MSRIRINSVSLKNYRSFGNTEQEFIFPAEGYNKPVAIVGYNNSGKTNLMNAILYGLQFNFVSKDSFSINDFHNKDIINKPEITLDVSSSTEEKYDGKQAILNGVHKLNIQTDGDEIEGSKIESYKSNIIAPMNKNWQAFGASRYFNIFYINFHTIKDEISTKKTSWGNLKSFLAKHIRKIVEEDSTMQGKKGDFETSLKSATDEILEDSRLTEFIESIKENYCVNLRDNNCHIDFSLPPYEDIFLKMMFKIGLNGDNNNLVPIDHFGDGYISMFVMAVIQAIAESNTDDKCLFLFEEPESFLHENHQEYFYKMVLCNLADKGHQVIYTTHSDKMVNMFDTKGLIRIEFDETSKQTLKKYNKASQDFNQELNYEENGQIISLREYNSYIKNIEPNLNKILFSRKVILVEGPNDVMAYKYAIEKYILGLGKDRKYAETYLNFNNIAIIPHHGKATALLLIQLCKHIGVDYFVINDLDFDNDFVNELFTYGTEDEFKQSQLYLNEGNSNKKGMLTTNWKLTNSAGNGKIHFNIQKLESVLGYTLDDKDSVKLWNLLQGIDTFGDNFFPESLKGFLEFDAIPPEEPVPEETTAEEASAEEIAPEEPTTPAISSAERVD